MSSIFCKRFQVFFKILCTLVVILMITFWMYKYYGDKDLCLVDYKIVEDLQEESLPVLSVCFNNPFIEKNLRQLNPALNNTYYLEHLRGNIFDDRIKSLEFENTIINFTDYIDTTEVIYRNGSNKTFASTDTQSIVQHYITFSGFWYFVFIRCFGASVKNEYKHVVHFIQFYFKRDEYLDNAIVEHGHTFHKHSLPKTVFTCSIELQQFLAG